MPTQSMRPRIVLCLCLLLAAAGPLAAQQVNELTVQPSGTSKTYENPAGTPFQPVQDTAVFPCQ